MSDMVGKVSVQAKIAELESRINDLEREAELFWGFAPKNYYRSRWNASNTVSEKRSGVFGEHWDKMWVEFDLAIKDIFK
jgi:hypothetical protein